MVDITSKAKVKWHGKWIWANYITGKRTNGGDRCAEFKPLGRDEMNIFVMARRKFELKQLPTKAIINITADSRYKLFVNGKWIGRGINRCEAYYWYYNQYDITKYLKTGENVIAVHAVFYGMEFAYYQLPEQSGRDKSNAGKGGILFEVGLTYNGLQPSEWIGSDEKTKVIRNLSQRSDVPIKNDALGFVEEFDSRKLAKNWNDIDFNDSGWETPFILDYPIKTLMLDENAPLFETLVYPNKIIEIGECEDILSDPTYDEKDLQEMDFCIQNLMEGRPNPLSAISVRNEEVLLGQPGVCEITPRKGGKALSILLQFEKEQVGRPIIVIDGPAGTIVDIIPTEKMKANSLDLDFLSQKRGSRLILRGGKQYFEQWNWEGFLYVQIRIRKLTAGPVKIFSFANNQTHMQTTRQGKFECNDSKITKLWDSCAYTLLCCAIDAYLDCPSREQRAYVGDAYPESLLAFATFGEPRLTKKLIYDIAFGQRKDGITFSFHPGDYTQQCHIIPDYNLYWMQVTWDYYRYYGDEQVLIDMYHPFIRSMDWWWKYIDPEMGLIGEEVPYWKFIDWGFPSIKPGYNAILNTQFVDVLLIISRIAEKRGDFITARKYRDQANKMSKIIDQTFWDDVSGCYHDYFKDGKLSEQISMQTNAYLVLKGIASHLKWQSIIDKVFDSKEAHLAMENLVKNRRQNKRDPNSKQIIQAEPFFMHHVDQFFAKVNRFDLMLKYFRLGWGPMLEQGPTGTIWETWAPDGSECHAWSATPAYDLSTHWLGVKPLEPGFRRVEVSPCFTGFEKVTGSFPSCKGDIEVKWRKSKEDEMIAYEVLVRLPKAISSGVFRVLPLDGQPPKGIETDARPMPLSVDNPIKGWTLQSGDNIFTVFY